MSHHTQAGNLKALIHALKRRSGLRHLRLQLLECLHVTRLGGACACLAQPFQLLNEPGTPLGFKCHLSLERFNFLLFLAQRFRILGACLLLLLGGGGGFSCCFLLSIGGGGGSFSSGGAFGGQRLLYRGRRGGGFLSIGAGCGQFLACFGSLSGGIGGVLFGLGQCFLPAGVYLAAILRRRCGRAAAGLRNRCRILF